MDEANRNRFEQVSLKRFEKEIDFLIKAILPPKSVADILASLVIGSSLIVLSDIPPKWHDLPVIRLVGYLITGIMSFWLLVTTLRRGKM